MVRWIERGEERERETERETERERENVVVKGDWVANTRKGENTRKERNSKGRGCMTERVPGRERERGVEED